MVRIELGQGTSCAYEGSLAYLTTYGFHTNSEYIFTVLRITLKKSHLIKWPANSENPYWNF